MKILQLIIIITFNVCALLPGTVADKADFVFLGRRRQNIKPTKNFQNSKEFDEFDYYISNNEASWTVAIDECVLTFPNGHLIALETQAEWKYIKREIDDYGGTTFWTSGLFDTSSKKFRWYYAENLPKWNPWGSKFPPDNPDTDDRVIIVIKGLWDAYWEVVKKTKLLRYVCESPVDPSESSTTVIPDPQTPEPTDPPIIETTSSPSKSSTTVPPEERICGDSPDIPIANRLILIASVGSKEFYHPPDLITAAEWNKCQHWCQDRWGLELAELTTMEEWLGLVKHAPYSDYEGIWLGSKVENTSSSAHYDKDRYHWVCSGMKVMQNLWCKGYPKRHDQTNNKNSCIQINGRNPSMPEEFNGFCIKNSGCNYDHRPLCQRIIP